MCQSEIVVIRALFDAVHSLELDPLPTELLDLYQPLESLSDCELFQRPVEELEPSRLKDFHQIYQYVQSQLLTRLCLSCAHNPVLAHRFIRANLPRLTAVLDTQLALDAQSQQSLTTSTDLQTRLSARRADHTSSAALVHHHHPDHSISHLRGLSLDVGAKYLAIAVELRRLDDVLQTESESAAADELRQLAMTIERIERTLTECSEDFQRFALSYHRLVHGGSAGSERPVTVLDTNITNEGNCKYKLENSLF